MARQTRQRSHADCHGNNAVADDVNVMEKMGAHEGGRRGCEEAAL